MTHPLVYHPEVLSEVDEAFAWYEQQRTGLGERLLTAIRETLDSVQENPRQVGVIHRNVRAALVRRFPYVVYFREESTRIVVIAIQHGRRDPKRWQSRA
jgi:plasmid stabilization system protein ParE